MGSSRNTPDGVELRDNDTETMTLLSPRAEALAIFNVIDLDCNGFLDEFELSQGLDDFGTCDNDIAVIFTMLDADGDGQISKQEFVEGYHKLALLPPVSRAPISPAPVDDQTANGQHNTLSHCDDLGSPKTESIYHQISLTQNPFLRQTQQQLISI